MQSGIVNESSEIEVETKVKKSVLKRAKVSTTNTVHIVYSGIEDDGHKQGNQSKSSAIQSNQTSGETENMPAMQCLADQYHDTMTRRVTFRATPELHELDTLDTLVELTIDDETEVESTSAHRKIDRHTHISTTGPPNETQTLVAKTELVNEQQIRGSRKEITNELQNRVSKTRADSPKRTNPTSPRRKQCSFQARGKLAEKDKTRKEVDELKKRFALPDRMGQRLSNPAANWESVIEQTKRRLEKQRRSERPWLHGSEMTSFFHKLWQQDTSGPCLSKSVRRTSSLPRNFKLPDLKLRSKYDPSLDLGILRECCCSPRSRVRTFSSTER